jgi:hypothetical protein
MNAKPPSFALSCVTENRPDWFPKVRNLVLSVRRYGGSMQSMPILVNIVGSIDRGIWSVLERQDVELRVVEPFHPLFPHTNKLRMFEQSDFFGSSDVLIAADCDVILVDDPSSMFTVSTLRAKPEDEAVISDDVWLDIYSEMAIDEPARDCRMTSTGEVTYPWWNSGVIGIPTEMIDTLFEQWSQNIAVVERLYIGGRLPANWVSDQVGFACAVLQTQLPLLPLPITGNFPTHMDVHEDVRRDAPGPSVIIHYHHGITKQGFVRPTNDEVINSQIDQFNFELAQHTGQKYCGLDAISQPKSRASRFAARTQERLAGIAWYRSARLRPLKAGLRRLFIRARSGSRTSG